MKKMRWMGILVMLVSLILLNGKQVQAVNNSSFSYKKQSILTVESNTKLYVDSRSGNGVSIKSGSSKGGIGQEGSSIIQTVANTQSPVQDFGLGDLENYKGTNPSSTRLKSKAGVILGAIQNIGIVVSVVMLMVIGIKYMLGSVEEKANYKKTLVPYLIGALFLFTGTLIPQLIYKIMKEF